MNISARLSMPPNHATDPNQVILVIDDSRAQRRLLSSQLNRLGYEVIEAESGEEALDVFRQQDPDLIVSDWMMPGMTGLDVCRAYRAMRKDRYGYFILLTSKSDKGDIAEGLDVGADDFLTKPCDPAELRARINAGQRVLQMERELSDKNRIVTATLAEMQQLYDAIDKDLHEARKLQQSLVRERFVQVNGADVSLMLHPAGHVGGDLVGVFPVNDGEIGFYSLDVSGHGIASALLTARLAGHLTGNTPDQNLAIATSENGIVMRSPGEVVKALNNLILSEIETEHYFTILLAKANLRTGLVQACQAGHPHPVVQRNNGAVELPGVGGLPVGLIPGADFDEFEIQLSPGDRIFLGSDGITECEGADGAMLDDDGLSLMMADLKPVAGLKLLEDMFQKLEAFNGGPEFADDVSGVLFEFNGLKR